MKQLLVFVLLSGLLVWLLFTPAYKHVLLARHALLQKEADYLLETGASGLRGTIAPDMIAESRQRLSRFGFRPNSIEYTVEAGGGLDPGAGPLPRGTPIAVTLAYPYEQLFALDRLLGIAVPGSEDRMKAYGIRMSEYVPD